MKKCLLIALLFHFGTLASEVNPSILKQLDSHFNETLDEQSPGATVLISKDGEIVFHNAYGMADVENKVKMETDHHLRIASITKQFTTVAVQLLAEQGKVKMSDDINEHLPGYPTHGEKITLHHLASNTSGIPHCQMLPGWTEFEKEDHSLEEILAFFSDEPLNFKPGTDFEYSSSNFMLLAKLIEVKSGLTYEEFLKKHIFDPVGMDSTFVGSETKIQPNRAHGYTFRNGVLGNADALSMTVPHGAGALRSTTLDIFKWQTALMNGDILSEKSLKQAWQPALQYDRTSTGENPYGYGWFLGTIDGTKAAFHSGGIPGFSSFSALLPEKNIQVVILHNMDNNPEFYPEKHAAKAIKALTAGSLMPRFVDELPSEYKLLLGDYKGDYFGGLEGTIIEKDNRLIFVRRWEDTEVELHLAEDGNLYNGESWTQIIPIKEHGKITAIKFLAWSGISWLFEKTDSGQ